MYCMAVCVLIKRTGFYQIDFRGLCNISVMLLIGFGLITPIYNDIYANKTRLLFLQFVNVLCILRARLNYIMYSLLYTATKKCIKSSVV